MNLGLTLGRSLARYGFSPKLMQSISSCRLYMMPSFEIMELLAIVPFPKSYFHWLSTKRLFAGVAVLISAYEGKMPNMISGVNEAAKGFESTLQGK